METKTSSSPHERAGDVAAPAAAEAVQSAKIALNHETLLHFERTLALVVDQQREIVKALLLLSARIAEIGSGAVAAAAPLPDPTAELEARVEASPSDPEARVQLAMKLVELERFAEAEGALREAIRLNPRGPQTHTLLGDVLRRLGRTREAVDAYQAAIAIDSASRARPLLVDLHVAEGQLDHAFVELEAALEADPNDAAPLRKAAFLALRSQRFDAAQSYSHRSAVQMGTTRFWPEKLAMQPPAYGAFSTQLKAPKLRHDIEQLTYLQRKGILGEEFDPIVEGYRRALERVAPFDDARRTPMNDEERRTIGYVYNRIVHIAPSPRVEKALSYAWDMKAIEEDYILNPPGIITIDKLLSDEALSSLRRFCLESTIWSTDRYANGYLGAFFEDGFSSPLLFQIAEELRAAMPRVIGDRRLIHMWAFKYDQEMAGINLHADVAAVNVNFWLTPDDANLDKDSGGLIVYDVEAPQDWGFELYNGGRANEEIQAFLDRSKARAVNLPYRQNRAAIFNSDLFHRTAPFRFKPGYENRRINVTMLYGDRSQHRLDTSRVTTR